MRKLFLLLTPTCLVLFTVAQSYTWQWAKTATLYDTNTYAYANCITTDIAGNVIVAGGYGSDSITFGSFTLYNPTAPGDSQQVYVVKYDSSGNVLWAANGTGALGQWADGITTDKNGNIYIGGQFESPFLVFDNDTIYQTDTGQCHFCTAPWNDGYVAKFNPNGQVQWVRKFGGNSWDAVDDMIVDQSDNLYISAWYRSDTVIFGGDTLYDSTLNGDDNVALLKCDTSGHVIWAKNIAWGWGGYLALDPAGNIFFDGGFWGTDTIIFGSHKVGTIDGVQDFFLAKYDANGNALWALNTGITGTDAYAAGISTDGGGNVYLTGDFTTDSVRIGPVTLHNNVINNYSFFITKYDSGGNVLWANGASGTAYGNSIATDANNNTWVTGNFTTPSVTFTDSMLYNPDSATSGNHIFMTAYDTAGHVVSALAVGGNSYDYSNCLTMDQTGNIYLGGQFYSDTFTLGSNVLLNSGNDDGNPFIARYSALAPPLSIRNVQPDADNLVNVFPNPSETGEWTIQISNNLLGSSATIFDMHGKMVYKAEISDSNTHLNLPLAGGVYMLVIISGNNREIRKLVKL